MGYAIRQTDDHVASYLREAMVDTISDIPTVPTNWPAGSTFICLEDSSVWMLGTDAVWHEIGGEEEE